MNKRNPTPNMHGHKARKRFGQNFLHDPYIIGKIVSSIHPKESDCLVEIGPGMGALTEPLLEATGKLQVVELDRDLIPILRTKFFNYPNFRIHEGDAMKFDFTTLLEPGQKLRIVGNLPYNISTPLIFHLLSYHARVDDMHFMLQKEVVERLAAAPGSSDYGRLGIMAQYYCRVEPLFIVGPGSFNPPPKVDSAIVRLRPYEQLPIEAKSVATLQQVVREAFSMRRKTIRNTMRNLISAEQLEALGIDTSLRPEVLTLEQYVRIADAVFAERQVEPEESMDGTE
ncbi:16S rRNA (adenine(1518)-N(6)/adenine(1519)-N(6))-dimethyltransferase RsmA [Parathalassolituus penaei]|uniref:Ribosomal RNA small subunit methyltransferase A n=1 Tax=Parathalassolituus penaei TaxID=2997323 RepID=A0A9X3EBI8_9GAMM|nr:16S rRNA (adenine(1518)-N(6)/adenine(1519)-N(6))-dimethyltransferase RsmA [Parathalassolituus penaei]MCY0963814.1 16S rRNA (adenine(1518)-N(6)/adenine(1519)-N(6))-dimethyltransferase RsmA [Parathalassolituus penaei]